MPGYIPELIKQIRETGDFPSDASQKIVAAVMARGMGIRLGRRRIAAERELAAVREVGKKIGALSTFGGGEDHRLHKLDSFRDRAQIRD